VKGKPLVRLAKLQNNATVEFVPAADPAELDLAGDVPYDGAKDTASSVNLATSGKNDPQFSGVELGRVRIE
jgi:hypothetical protein